jgi:hypothetical protein
VKVEYLAVLVDERGLQEARRRRAAQLRRQQAAQAAAAAAGYGQLTDLPTSGDLQVCGQSAVHCRLLPPANLAMVSCCVSIRVCECKCCSGMVARVLYALVCVELLSTD